MVDAVKYRNEFLKLLPKAQYVITIILFLNVMFILCMYTNNKQNHANIFF